jgi:hypothetical protein
LTGGLQPGTNHPLLPVGEGKEDKDSQNAFAGLGFLTTQYTLYRTVHPNQFQNNVPADSIFLNTKFLLLSEAILSLEKSNTDG